MRPPSGKKLPKITKKSGPGEVVKPLNNNKPIVKKEEGKVQFISKPGAETSTALVKVEEEKEEKVNTLFDADAPSGSNRLD